MSHNNIVLGIDCSSSCIGLGILDISGNQIKFVDMLYIKPPKKGELIERLAETRAQLQTILLQYQPSHIAIEEIISFMPGKSTAQTIIMLTTFNRMACLLAYDYLKSCPKMLSVMTIRHGLKLSKDLPKKENMPELVSHHLGIDFPFEYNKKNNLKVENFDKADGMAVALYYAKFLTNQLNKKGKKKSK